ncbi:MAG: tetratricopeptide repeat protein, partial [Thermoanaerobaculia bacterium]
AYYNIGNCYFQKEDFLNAIEFYKKALDLDPNDEDAKINLELARKKLKDQAKKQQQQQQQQNQMQQKEEKKENPEEKKKEEQKKDEAEKIMKAIEDKEKDLKEKQKRKVQGKPSGGIDW